MSWLKTILWYALTGGPNSPLLRMPEDRPYRMVKTGGRLLVEPIPTQMDVEAPEHFSPGQRVLVMPHAGFHAGARGTVEYHAPDGRVWIKRDGSTQAVFYYPHELTGEP